MIWNGEFDVYEHPMIRWRWKVSNVYIKGNALQKSGDDYPMRIYVMFKYDTKDPHVKKKFKYGLAKFLYGKYPPYTSLNYIWANREHQQRFIPNPFEKEVMMLQAFKRWGFEAKDNNECDAYCLRRMAREYMDGEWTKKFRATMQGCEVIGG